MARKLAFGVGREQAPRWWTTTAFSLATLGGISQDSLMKTPILSINCVRFLALIVLACVGPWSTAQALTPPPDGGYPGGNTAEGTGALESLTTGRGNTAVGNNSLQSITTAFDNTAIGAFSLNANTSGRDNTATGITSLSMNTSGRDNTATGSNALGLNTTGIANTATGTGALFGNDSGSRNTAIGGAALSHNNADNNTAIGFQALTNNTNGTYNTASGYIALFGNTSGGNNTADGAGALLSNTTGSGNTATGTGTLITNTTGEANMASGAFALISNTTGSGNTADGFQALFLNNTGMDNTAIGVDSLLSNTGSNNVAIGSEAGNSQTNGSNNVYIGAGMVGIPGESNACYIASIFGETSANGVPVLINSNSQLGTATSSKRFKDDIKPMDKASEVLFALKPVSFRYKREIDPAGRSQFGLVAEQVEKVNPDLIVRDKQGRPYSVRYDQVNAMLLNEFLKAYQKIEEQGATIAKQQKQIEALTAGLQKVSAQLETNKLTPQMVANDQ